MVSPSGLLRRRRIRARGRGGLRGPLIVVVLFLTVGVVASVVVANTLTVPTPGDTSEYSAEFTDVEGLQPGDAVTAAGVRVGRVESVTRTDADNGGAHALVGFDVRDDVTLDAQVHAAVRYGDMLGVRYVALTAPLTPSGEDLPAGARIPIGRTSPPLDLTAVFNGFKPLFEALDPEQVNTLARSVVDAFGGRSGGVGMLLTRIGDVTENLSSHREAIGRVVTNLGALAEAANQRGTELNSLIDGLARLGGTLAQHNQRLISVLDHGSSAAAEAADLLQHRVDTLEGTLHGLRDMTGSWVENTDDFHQTIAALVPFTERVGRTADYGSWLQLYTCTLTAKAGGLEVNLLGPAHSEVCR